MSYIKLNDPGQVQSYSYPIHPLEFPNEKERLITATEIGGEIKPEYENGSKMTPARKKKLIAITVAALSAIAAATVVIAACVSQIYPLAAIAIPFAAVGLAGGLYAVFKRKDFDSPEYRAAAQEKIKDLSLKELAHQHNIHTVVGYRLLDAAPAVQALDETEQVIFYTKYKKLVKELNLLENWRNNEIQRVNDIWGNETLSMRSWYNDQMRMMDQGRMIRHQNTVHMHSRIRHREAVTGRREVGLRTVNAVASGFNIAADIADSYEEHDINRLYEKKMAPWDKWLRQEKNQIKRAFDKALLELEAQFIEMKL